MRDIKFRGKRVDTGAWVYGDLIHHDKGCAIVRCNEFTVESSFEVHPESVGQFTGLKDKEVYENDIVEFCLFQGPMGNIKEHYNGKVIFKDGSFYVEFLNGWKGPGSGSIDHIFLFRLKTDWKVIGNVYDNPELLVVAG